MRQVHQIPRQKAIEYLQNDTAGLIFSAYFAKTDGTMRTMVCRRGVTKYRKGGTLPYDPKTYQLLPVFDMQKREYRSVNLATLDAFAIHGETFIVI